MHVGFYGSEIFILFLDFATRWILNIFDAFFTSTLCSATYRIKFPFHLAKCPCLTECILNSCYLFIVHRHKCKLWHYIWGIHLHFIEHQLNSSELSSEIIFFIGNIRKFISGPITNVSIQKSRKKKNEMKWDWKSRSNGIHIKPSSFSNIRYYIFDSRGKTITKNIM